jgi:hypothetical protein
MREAMLTSHEFGVVLECHPQVLLRLDLLPACHLWEA